MEIQYIDDIVDSAETPYEYILVEDNEEESKASFTEAEANSSDIESYKATERVYKPIQKEYDIKPFTGKVGRKPSKMIFGTWQEQVSYIQAYKRSNSKSPASNR